MQLGRLTAVFLEGFLDEGIWVGRRRGKGRREGVDEKREKEKLTKERVGRIQKCDQGGFVV